MLEAAPCTKVDHSQYWDTVEVSDSSEPLLALLPPPEGELSRN